MIQKFSIYLLFMTSMFWSLPSFGGDTRKAQQEILTIFSICNAVMSWGLNDHALRWEIYKQDKVDADWAEKAFLRYLENSYSEDDFFKFQTIAIANAMSYKENRYEHIQSLKSESEVMEFKTEELSNCRKEIGPYLKALR